MSDLEQRCQPCNSTEVTVAHLECRLGITVGQLSIGLFWNSLCRSFPVCLETRHVQMLLFFKFVLFSLFYYKNKFKKKETRNLYLDGPALMITFANFF